ncbi:hypothetical protein PHLGIDRAFT_23479 [Phlebiopsis gigantea 11061_1 CR5-6]|uniref:NAD(P)-binding protein n=1 Tax=Phlebiopsis gigantea (strain 11061_1 CR5-6) TaxID=745531 RepID=A0A0C3PNW9_PHLG1|nr:hypothetical protein PHLGIDRAFT_23479 [Phlebiopsis gigantea 11061_1 CR5-6]
MVFGRRSVCGTNDPLHLLDSHLAGLSGRAARSAADGSRRTTSPSEQEDRDAYSGIGRSIANQYAKRGARVCVVGRNFDKLAEVSAECWRLRDPNIQEIDITPVNQLKPNDPIIALEADFADAMQMDRVKSVLKMAWGGVDTVVVTAGVSSLMPLLEVAGVHSPGEEPTVEGVQRTLDVSNAALRGNFSGPLVSAVALIPLLESSSRSPAIALLSSVAAIVPAPTRSLYAATKGASLLLYQSLAIEHPRIQFTYIFPSTVEGDFRASAVDRGPVRESNPNKHGLKREYVARRCIESIDVKERNVFLPYLFGRVGHLLYWVAPSIVERFARKKYKFTAA